MSQVVDIQADGASDGKVGSPALRPAWRRHGALIGLCLGGAALTAPTLIENIQQYWSLEQGAQAPIVLAIGLWLLVRRWPVMQAAGAPPKGAVFRALVVGLWGVNSLVYLAGRVGGLYVLESYALYGFLLIGLYSQVGARGLRAGGFPLAYLVFALPIPFFITHTLTTHLRLWITEAIVQLFQACGLTIVKDGLTLMVDQYQLSVEDACSGLNSLFSLSAIGVVYVYLRRAGQPLYYGLMLAPIVGFATLGNFVRIAMVVLITHVFGDAVAQSLLHETIGFVTFAVSLGGVIALDALVGPLLARQRLKVSVAKALPPAMTTASQ